MKKIFQDLFHFMKYKVLNFSDDLRGSHFQDPLLYFLKGYKKYSKHYVEFLLNIESFRGGLFPLESENEVNFEEYFRIEGSEDLSSFFRNEAYFTSGFPLRKFISEAIQQICLYGKVFYAVKWEPIVIGERTYVLPTSFSLLAVSTVSKRLLGGYKQRYSWVSRFLNPSLFFKNRNFHSEEVFSIKAPQYHLMKSYFPYRIRKAHFYQRSLDAIAARTTPTDLSFKFEKTRSFGFSARLRNKFTRDQRVMDRFTHTFGYNGKITNFYDLYSVAKKSEFQNEARGFFIEQLNKTLLAEVARRNDLSFLKIELAQGAFNNKDFFDKIISDFSSGTINYREAVKRITQS